MKSKRFEVETLYDYEEDIFDILVKEDYDHNTSIELSPGIILDFDNNNVPVSLEILWASKILGVDKRLLSNHGRVEMSINITEKLISVEVKIETFIHNKEYLKSLNYDTVNNINAPIMQTELATV